MTRNVIKGEHGEDADGRGQGLEDVWFHAEGNGELQGDSEQS